MIFVGGKSIAYATSHSLSLGSSTVESSTKDSGPYEGAEVNKLSWEISADHLFVIEEFDSLVAQWKSKQAVTLVWGKRAEDPEQGCPADGDIANWTPAADWQYTGKAYITSLNVNAPNGDKASYSVTFKGDGDFKKVTV